MKVLFLHSSSDMYGASRILLQTLLIAKLSNIIPVVYLSEKGLLSDELEKNGIEVRILRLGILRRKYANPVGLINRFFFILRATYILRNAVRKEKIRIIYNNSSSVFCGCLVAKITGSKHIWHIHEIIKSPGWLAWLVGKCMQHLSDINVVVSGATRDHWLKINPKIKKETLILIYNGLMPEYFEIKPENNEYLSIKDRHPDNTLFVGMIARVHPWKGQEYFIEIGAELIKNHKNICLLMAGDAYPGNEYLYSKIEKIKEELDISNYVIDLGYIADSRKFFELIDIMILPSVLPDPFPTTILEAMSLKIPVVATKHGGATEMVEQGKTGELIPWDNAKEAARIIQPLLNSSKLRGQYGELAKDRLIKSFSIEIYKENILNVINSLA